MHWLIRGLDFGGKLIVMHWLIWWQIDMHWLIRGMDWGGKLPCTGSLDAWIFVANCHALAH